MAKYKAKASYKELNDSNNFNSLLSASSHLKLIADDEIEWKGKIPKKLADNLIEIKNTSKGGKE